MRFVMVVLAAALSACTLFPAPTERTALTLAPADAATSLALSGPIILERSSRAARDGQDPLVRMTLKSSDGRTLSFTEANHTPHDVMTQAAGGALAQVMGFYGQETPTLYRADGASNNASPSPFLCGPTGPVTLGFYEAPGGTVTIVGLKSDFEFESLRNGTEQALPFSPDQVCARLKLRRS
jgi:hypothetical protein